MENLTRTSFSTWAFIWQEKRAQLVGVILLTTALFLFIYCSHDFSTSLYGQYIDPIIGLVTPITAIFIWYNDNKREWEKTLPQKLTAHFIHKGVYVMSCLNAPLIGEHDVRAYGQSIGGQMSELRGNLPLETFFEYSYHPKQANLLPNHPVAERLYNLHVITFYISKNITEPTVKKVLENNVLGKYTVWLDNNSRDGESAKLRPITPCPTVPISELEAFAKLMQQKQTNA